MLGGHVRAVFTLVTFLFIICVFVTITSFREVPLWLLDATAANQSNAVEEETAAIDTDKMLDENAKPATYGAMPDTKYTKPPLPDRPAPPMRPPPPERPDYGSVPGENVAETSFNKTIDDISVAVPIQEESMASLSDYLMSILYMPHSMRMVCLTNLFCWMAHVCYSLYFTDFVGEAVFGGDPMAAEGSAQQTLYSDGVRFGCWGMAMYSLSCACYSLIIEKLIKKFG